MKAEGRGTARRRAAGTARSEHKPQALAARLEVEAEKAASSPHVRESGDLQDGQGQGGPRRAARRCCYQSK